MATTQWFVDRQGKAVEPGEYRIVDTLVRVTEVRRANGFDASEQSAVLLHTVEPVHAREAP